MTRLGWGVGAAVVAIVCVLLSFLVHERAVTHIEKQVANVTITG